ncbi:MAG TPA: hypothetical protein VGB77_22505 [Abditibacteriaceae bacterium]
MKENFSWKEAMPLLLPALIFVIWALLTSEDDVRSNFNGKWRSTNGNTIEFRVQGNELLVWINGRKDPKASYHFLGDNLIEFVDRRRNPPIQIPITVRIRRGVLEQNIGTEHVRAYRIE